MKLNIIPKRKWFVSSRALQNSIRKSIIINANFLARVSVSSAIDTLYKMSRASKYLKKKVKMVVAMSMENLEKDEI